jgi:ParB family transcriptional regulator, chromosome partitioning protein
VTQHVTLLDLPDPIAGAFNAGRVKDVTVVNELVTAFKKKPKEVSGWLGDENQEITRGAVKLLREFLENKLQHERADQNGDDGEGASGDDQGDYDTETKPEKQVDPDKLRKAIVQVRHNRRSARLILNRRPPAEGFAWLRYEDDGQEVEANLAQVRLVALVEG